MPLTHSAGARLLSSTVQLHALCALLQVKNRTPRKRRTARTKLSIKFNFAPRRSCSAILWMSFFLFRATI
jgi:hypothetical protein